ncbi:MAG: hypothetical protein IJ724_04540 [Muribaculaceae bacterium]|nr:hypothetical protein [Muribaculaceae bacterium]MBR1725908.1 hypothetical protein [Muribaculaceae bacterium]
MIKRLLCLLVVCNIAQLYCCGLEVQREYVVSYTLSDFVITQNQRGISTIHSNKQLIMFETDSTKPALPYLPINILLGPEESVRDASVVFDSDTVLCQINMATCSELYPTNVKYNSNKSIQGVWPDTVFQKRAEYIGTNLSDGYKYASLILVPFEYNTASRCLSFFREITIHLSIEAPESSHCQPLTPAIPAYIGNNMRNIVKEQVVNPSEMNTLYQQSTQSVLDEDDYEYLIVTADSFATTMQELAEWKSIKGIKTKVLTTSEIYNSYTSGSNQYRIKCALMDYYNGQHQGLKYALLAGTTTFVPAQICDIKVVKENIIYHDSTPADLFYACFDTMDWDTNGNGINGEVEDQVDISPEIVVTRALINSDTEAQTFVRRIIDYEKNPTLENWEDNILLAGAKLKWDTIYDSDGRIRSDSEYYGDLVTNTLAPLWSGRSVKLFDTYTDFPGEASYQFNAEHLHEELSKGYTIVNVDTHGGNYLWETEEDFYYAPSAAELYNANYSFINTSACNVNHFDELPGLSHSFMTNPNSGIIAFVGPSRYGWSPTSEAVSRSLFRQLFEYEGYLGKAFTFMKFMYAPFCRRIGLNDAKRWVLFATNAITDPEMPIYLSKPKVMNCVKISINNGVLDITTGIDSCNVCVMSSNDNGESIYSVSKNVNSFTLNSVNTSVSVCITHIGYIPYIVEVSPHVYIQDETLAGRRHIVGEQIDVGFDVTSTRPNGSVIVNGEEIILSGTKNVTIKNNFEVKKGSTLKINSR